MTRPGVYKPTSYRHLTPACPYCGGKRTVQDCAPYCTATCQFLAEREKAQAQERPTQ